MKSIIGRRRFFKDEIDYCADSNRDRSLTRLVELYRNVSIVPLGEDEERDKEIEEGWKKTNT